MLFKVSHNKSVFKDNPSLKGVAEFAACSDRDLKFVFWTYDYESPYKRMEIDRRKKECATAAGFKLEGGRLDKNGRNTINGLVPKVQKALGKFLDMQFDEDKENLDAYRAQLEDFRIFFHKKNKTAIELQKALGIMEKFTGLVRKKKELEEVLGLRSIEESTEDDISDLSTLDKINMEEYG